MANDNKLMIIDESTLKDKIYTIRGQQVMLDSDLAMIYGYEVKRLNEQVKYNINRFPEDFMFQITKEEINALRSDFSTANINPKSRSHPHVFTEQGIYMLATVLKGELAERQSVAIMRVFKAMREYISQNKQLLPQQELLQLSARQTELEDQVKEIKDNMVSKTNLSDFMKLFDQGLSNEEVLILDGMPFKADEAYQKIYKSAKCKILIIDDYIGIKTLHHLAHSKKTAKITIISDNVAKPKLRLTEYNDFIIENPDRIIIFLQSLRRTHDRYIVLDEGTKDMKIYHCGASSKDAGKRITSITRVSDINEYKSTIKAMLNHPALMLR